MIEKIRSNIIENKNEVIENNKANFPKFFNDLSMPKDGFNSNLPVDKTPLVKDKELMEKDNIISIRTRNESLEGDVHPYTGVPFEKRIVDTQDGKVEGVFPKFEKIFETNIPKEYYEESDRKQFNICNEELKDRIESNPEFSKKFNKEQLEQIMNGDTPDGYVWHHDSNPGKMQLVEFKVHADTGHTGGRFIWGGGKENR